MYRIGLTGGIASGKSAAARKLESLGAVVLDADEAARRAVEPGSEGLERIAECFGADMLKADGSLDRSRLGAKVFSDGTALQRLNGILHPLIRKELERGALEAESEDPGRIVVLDVPLLIECGWQDMADEIWLVTAPAEARVRRIMARDGLDEAGARRRIAAQMTDEEKLPYADHVIQNGGDIEEFERKVAALYGALTVQYGKTEEENGNYVEDRGGVSGAVPDDGGGVSLEPRAGEAKV